jgi:hypothetical protein
MDSEVRRQLKELRIVQDEQRIVQDEQRIAQAELREQICALKARDDASGLLSPTSIREVMDSLRSNRRYDVVPLSSMRVFGWSPAKSHITFLTNVAGSSGLQRGASRLPSSTLESPISEREQPRNLASAKIERRQNPVRSAATKHAATSSTSALTDTWRTVFSNAATVPARGSVLSDKGRSTADTTSASAPAKLSLFNSLPTASKAGSSWLAETADLQPWFSRVLPDVDATRWNVNWVDGHKICSIGPRKPDCVNYAHRAGDGDGAVRSEFNIAYLGDWKSQKATGSGDMAEEELAHLLDFLMALARVQVWRRRFVGYLLDGTYVVFLSATFEPGRTPGSPPVLVRRSSLLLIYPWRRSTVHAPHPPTYYSSTHTGRPEY